MRAMIGLALALFSLAGAASAAEASGAGAAERWLALVDHGDYAGSYAGAGTLFKAKVTQEKWASSVAPTRSPLGSLVSRKVNVVLDRDTLPGAPDGRYEIIRFDSEFANKKRAIETVVLARESDAWTVDGYFIR